MIHSEAVHSLCVSEENSLLGSGSSKGEVRIWSIKTGKCLRRIEKAHTSSITALSFTKNGLKIIAASKRIKVFGIVSGLKLKQFSGHSRYLTDMFLTRNDKLLITSASVVKIWDFETKQVLKEIRP